MAGGLGNDTYVIDNVGDVVDRARRRRHRHRPDLAEPRRSRADFEKLVLTGTGNLNGTGNALANILTGNSGRQHRSTAAPAATP